MAVAERKYTETGYTDALYEAFERLRDMVGGVCDAVLEEQEAFPENALGENTAADLRDLENALGQMVETLSLLTGEEATNLGELIAHVDMDIAYGL